MITFISEGLHYFWSLSHACMEYFIQLCVDSRLLAGITWGEWGTKRLGLSFTASAYHYLSVGLHVIDVWGDCFPSLQAKLIPYVTTSIVCIDSNYECMVSRVSGCVARQSLPRHKWQAEKDRENERDKWLLDYKNGKNKSWKGKISVSFHLNWLVSLILSMPSLHVLHNNTCPSYGL